jgi:type IV secretory pathway ATPase VirB11/archaellum biosynthesis ATPase
MYSTYRLKADELSADFIQALKKTYRHREIEIIVQEIEDETDYLLFR